MEQFRRSETIRVVRKLQQDGKIVPINVTDAEMPEAFDRNAPRSQEARATVSWQQIVIAPKPTAAAKEVRGRKPSRCCRDQDGRRLREAREA